MINVAAEGATCTVRKGCIPSRSQPGAVALTSPQAVIESSLPDKTITFLASTSSLDGTRRFICPAEVGMRCVGEGAGNAVTPVCGGNARNSDP